MTHDSRGEEYGRSRWKFNHELEVPKNKMPSGLVVIGPKWCDATHTNSVISEVSVNVADGLWAEIVREAAVDTIGKDGNQFRITILQGIDIVFIRLIEVGAPSPKDG